AAPVRIEFTDYTVLYDPSAQGMRANSAYAVLTQGTLELVFTGPIEDDEAGTIPFLTETRDWGKSWSKPRVFGAEFSKESSDPDHRPSIFLAPFGPTPAGTILSVGYRVGKGVNLKTVKEDMRWRSSSALVGRRPKSSQTFSYTNYAPGTFLGEQFAYPGLVAGNRIILQIWGAGRQGENWQCGVLLSDDDGRTWRYRQVGYEPSPGIRDDPKTAAGFNEQTLFRTRGGEIVSIIRGREKLGRVASSSKDTWFFRSVSRDNGESWSKPELTDLPGTGAPTSGLTLPDGSLLMAARIPWSRTLGVPIDHGSFGLQFARSYDGGKTWRTEHVIQKDPQGRNFDNYYNTMNGEFIQTGPREWRYIFGQFDVKHSVHRILSLQVKVE
ncbi:MAG: sialidase family protein, partial [Bryobacteraceae bacterium]